MFAFTVHLSYCYLTTVNSIYATSNWAKSHMPKRCFSVKKLQPKKTSGLCYDNTALRRSLYTTEPVSSFQELDAFTVCMFLISYEYRILLYFSVLHIFKTYLFHNDWSLFTEVSLQKKQRWVSQTTYSILYLHSISQFSIQLSWSSSSIAFHFCDDGAYVPSVNIIMPIHTVCGCYSDIFSMCS